MVEERFQRKNGYEADCDVIYGDTDSVMVHFRVKARAAPALPMSCFMFFAAALLHNRKFITPHHMVCTLIALKTMNSWRLLVLFRVNRSMGSSGSQVGWCTCMTACLTRRRGAKAPESQAASLTLKSPKP